MKESFVQIACLESRKLSEQKKSAHALIFGPCIRFFRILEQQDFSNQGNVPNGF